MRCLAWLLIGAALAGCAAPPPPADLTAGPKTETIYLIERGWHTDIGVRTDQLGANLAALPGAFPGATVIVIGFGERAYLMEREHNSGDMLAALIPGPGALLVTGLRESPEQAFPDYPVIPLHVSARGVAQLDAFLANSFGPELQRIAGGPYSGSVFYAATPTYSAAFTCNTWTAEGLRAAGLPVHATGVLFAGGVTDQARRIAAQGQ